MSEEIYLITAITIMLVTIISFVLYQTITISRIANCFISVIAMIGPLSFIENYICLIIGHKQEKRHPGNTNK